MNIHASKLQVQPVDNEGTKSIKKHAIIIIGSLQRKIPVVFIVLCIVQIILISFLVHAVYRKTNKFTSFSHNIWVEPMGKKSFIYPITSNLKYYYEPAPLSQNVQQLSFVGLHGNATQTYNADGLNERYDYPIEKDDDVYRIVTVGDSFTDGLFVDTKDNYSEQLEDILNSSLQCQKYVKFEVINLGVSGYDMEYNLERFRRKGIEYHPDLVMYLAGQDDFGFSNELLRGKMIANDRLLKPTMGNTLEEQTASWKAAYKELFQEQKDAQNTMIQSELGYLTEFINSVPHQVLVMPYQIFDPFIENEMKQLLLFHHQVYYVPFEKEYDRFIDYHPTPAGHSYLARTLFAHIVRLGLIQCSEKNAEIRGIIGK